MAIILDRISRLPKSQTAIDIWFYQSVCTPLKNHSVQIIMTSQNTLIKVPHSYNIPYNDFVCTLIETSPNIKESSPRLYET